MQGKHQWSSYNICTLNAWQSNLIEEIQTCCAGVHSSSVCNSVAQFNNYLKAETSSWYYNGKYKKTTSEYDHV